MIEANRSNRFDSRFGFLFILVLVELVIFAGITLSIPSDQANAVFLGYTTSRLLILAAFFVLLVLTIVGYIFRRSLFNLLAGFFNSSGFVKIQSWVFLSVGSLLWFTVWLPASRFPEYQEEVTRLRPIVLTILLLLFQLLVFFRIMLQWQEIRKRYSWNQTSKRSLLWIGILFGAGSAFFILLKLISSSKLTNTLIFSSGPFLGPIQVFLGLVIFLAIFLVSDKTQTRKIQKPIWIALLIGIGLAAFAVWNFTPLSCADDRPGPYPPNDICYPQVDDSVYSIGSHYITLGRGVLNHWFTDKPFYMVFLAIGQWLLGDEIDTYLIFQIAVIAGLPVFLFLIGRKLSGIAGGFLAAFLSIVLGANNIFYYASAGGINVKIENTEILTGFLLVLCTFFLMKYLKSKRHWYSLLLSGGMLGLASLTRLNPLFVLPFLILLFLVINRKKWRKFLSITGMFLLGYLMIFIPGMLSARGVNGQFFYIQKIERILDTRYQRGRTSEIYPDTIAGKPQSNVVMTNANGTIQQVSYRTNSQSDGIFSTTALGVEEFVGTRTKYQTSGSSGGNLVNRLRMFALTSTNNLYLSLARLPVYFSFHSVSQIIKLPDGVTGQKLPMWQMKLSIENYLALALNLLVFLAGVTYSFSRWKWTAIVPLLVHFGYHLGNGAALTSGERYLEPVQWVTFLYFSVGVFAITRFVLKGNQPEILINEPVSKEEKKSTWYGKFSKKSWISLGVLILLGGLLPLTNLLPDKITARQQADLRSEVRSVLKQDSALKKINLKQFLESENAVIVEGIAYHPRQYDSPIYWREGEGFELTVLGESKVYVSNFFGQKPDEYFSDGSRVILLGCVVREKDFWGVETVILNTKGIIQLDHEKKQYFMHPSVFTCPKK